MTIPDQGENSLGERRKNRRFLFTSITIQHHTSPIQTHVPDTKTEPPGSWESRFRSHQRETTVSYALFRSSFRFLAAMNPIRARPVPNRSQVEGSGVEANPPVPEPLPEEVVSI